MKEKFQEKPTELSPNQIVRKHEGKKYFGYEHTQLDEKIKAGVIPAPISLTPGGRAKGWLGRTIIEYQRKLLADAGREADK